MESLLLFPDGKTAVGKCDEVVVLHEVESGQDRPLQSQKESPTKGRVAPVAVSPDGKVLAGGLWSSNIYNVWLWEVTTGKEILILKGNEGRVFAIAWSPDGRFVASGDVGAESDLESVRVWDMATGKQIAKFSGFASGVLSLAFSPDGAYLASGHLDSTILVWQLGKVAPKLTPQRLSMEELDAHWADLAGDDAPKAYASCWTLIAAAEQSVPFLRDRIKPVVAEDAAKVQKWIADLDSNEFTVRDAATKELKKLGSQAAAPIKKAIKGTLTAESRQSLARIAEELGEVVEPETLRVIRAVMVLEKIGSPEARAILQTLAKGAEGVRETEESKSALARLTTRRQGIP
jgi:dipeptidyl aminopeptidase/acylaminoacyl peptidase